MLHRFAGQDERVAPEDVVDIRPLLRQHIDPRQVARSASEILVESGAVDNQYRIPPQGLEPRPQCFGLGLADAGGIDDDKLPLSLFRRQCGLQAELAHLFLQREGVAAHHRAENCRAAAKLWGAQAPLTGAARALLLVRLFGRPLDFADPFGFVRPGAPLCQLPVDDTGEDVATDRKAENLLGQLDITDLVIVEIAHRQLHQAPPSAGFSETAASRRAAGNGSPSGALRFDASLTSTNPPRLPGTDPLIIRRPRSGSAVTT